MKTKPNLIPFSLLSLIAALLLWIVTRRPAFLLYNDDLLWVAPLSFANSHSWYDILRFTFQRDTELASPALNFSLAAYFHIFPNTPVFLFFIQMALHLGTALFFFLTLKILFGGQKRLAFFGAAFYLAGFPLFHVYVWPIALQHLWFAFFHFLILFLFLSERKDRFTLLWILIPLASLGRASFLFTLASLIWISFSTGRSMRKLTLPLAIACWYPLLQAFDATWGAQVEYFIIKFPALYKLIQGYRKIPYGWTIACALSVVGVSLMCRYLPVLKAQRRARIIVASGVFAFLAVESVFFAEEIYYLLISFLKTLNPGVSEFSKVVVYRWQPMPLYVPSMSRIAFLVAGVVVPSLSLFLLMRRFGTVMALFFIPIIPSLYYLRSRGLGTYVPELEGNTFYYCSRYALFIIPFVLVIYCGLLDLFLRRFGSVWARRSLSAVLCIGLGYHLLSIDRRLARTALAETVESFASMYPATLAFAAPAKKEIAVWIEDDRLSLGLRVITFEGNGRMDVPAVADPLVAGATSASRLLFKEDFSVFRLVSSRAKADVVRCGMDWCSSQGRPLTPRAGAGILARLALAPGESESAFFAMNRVKNWKEYIDKARFSPKPTGEFAKNYLLKHISN